MGGDPLMAIAILCRSSTLYPLKLHNEVLEGSRSICKEAAIPLAGGHGIDCPEPVFGLAVTGKVKKENIKQNNTAKVGSLLHLNQAAWHRNRK